MTDHQDPKPEPSPQELKSILESSKHDPTLLSFIQHANSRQRNRPSAFFAFPGTRGSMISLPPFQKWPIQTGWSFSTWFYLEPKLSAQPYLFNFKTGKSGLGYSAHFIGNCLVLTSIRVKGKGVQHCVPYEFPSYKWIHCAITYHSKWRASEIKVYVNGQLSANIEISWQVQTTEIFDKCFIGGSGSMTTQDRSGELNCFYGQMSAIYLFNEGLSPAQICAIHRLGPSYMGQFKYSNESHVNLPPQITKVLYEGRLASTLFCLFTPVAVDSGALCIQLAPLKSSTIASAHNYFISTPHAALQGQTKSIITQPICSTIQSLGFSQSLLPLLEVFASKGDSMACSSLIGFLFDLLESSPHWFANEIVQNNGFVIVACALANDARLLLSENLLDIFLNLTRTLLTTSTTIGDSLLLKHLMDNILFNPSLWIYADTKLQVKLYDYLATEFLHGTTHNLNKYTIGNSTASNSFVAYNPTSSAAAAISNQSYNYATPTSAGSDDKSVAPSLNYGGEIHPPSAATDLLFGEIRRVSTVLQSLHALKYFYWLIEERNINPKARNSKLRPNQSDLAVIRARLLLFTKELVLRANTTPLDEIQGILNYLSSCSHQENLTDVLEMLASLLMTRPAAIVPAIDQKQGVKVIFCLIGSKSEKIRVQALRLLALFLAQCPNKRKLEIMGPSNLFTLICDRLRPYRPLTLKTYKALIEIMLASTDSMPIDQQTDERDLSISRIENSIVVKVIATLLHDERNCQSTKQGSRSKVQADADNQNSANDNDSSNLPDIRKMFINDLWNLIVTSKENRRTILQMSVWQHWLINLIDSTIEDSQLVRDQVLSIFRVLLYHAIRYEYGGWRVWIDTLAIIHTKVSYDEFCQQLNPASPMMQSPHQHHQITRTHNEAAKFDFQQKRQVDHKDDESDANKKETKGIGQESSSLGESDVQHQVTAVSSISELVPREPNSIQMSDGTSGIDEPDSEVSKISDQLHEVDLSDEQTKKHEIDSVDAAPSRAYRNLNAGSAKQPGPDACTAAPANEDSPPPSNEEHSEVTRQQSLTSIPLDDPHSNDEDDVSPATQTVTETNNNEPSEIARGSATQEQKSQSADNANRSATGGKSASEKATASPAFRIPEFRWGSTLIKLLNDLMFSIECDLNHWRCLSKCTNLDQAPFLPKSLSLSGSGGASGSANNSAQAGQSSSSSRTTGAANVLTSAQQIELLLQKPENQIYIVNVIHFISQLADNIIIAAGGLLPLLAEATGGARTSSSSTATNAKTSSANPSACCEGLTMGQANSLLYRLVNMVDIVIFAASHVSLSELEADKNTTNGGILRQCLRLACTVTVKNCLVVRSIQQRIAAMNLNSDYVISASDFPKEMFDSYQGCSLLSANGLFENSALSLESSDLIANVEYSPNQTFNTSTTPSLLPFQSNPIKDPNKLLQSIDISRIQECIYHDLSAESRQSQFLALSSLYFISVLMVSKYRDIIEPKQRQKTNTTSVESTTSSDKSESNNSDGTAKATNSFQNGSSLSNIEENLLNFGRIHPNSSMSTNSTKPNELTDMLTTKLENTLDTVCPLLKSVMCDFCAFLSKTLIGSHGQDLVNKDADRTFRRANASPVELVMLLCSQEWQNTLQKNAGLAFIELINEGRVLSHSMKDHIVRVAMEAEFILSRLRADDVAKHENFSLACAEAQAARLHEEALINSLINSAARRDFVIYSKFKDSIQKKSRRNYKLDIWEDDDRRRRRFVVDSWNDSCQSFYSKAAVGSVEAIDGDNLKADTNRRILELQQSIELGGVDDHCSPAGTNARQETDDSLLHQTASADGMLAGLDSGRYDDCDDDDYEDDDDEDEMEHGADAQQDSNPTSPDSDTEQQQQQQQQKAMDNGAIGRDIAAGGGKKMKHAGSKFYSSKGGKSHYHQDGAASESKSAQHAPGSQVWNDYDDCGSINDFTGSVIFAAECSLIWNIYAIPGIFQLTNNELHFEPNQNISDAIDSLKNEQTPDQHDADSVSLKSSSFIDQQQQQQQGTTLRKIDLKVLRYCDFLTCNGKIQLDDIRAIFSRHYLLQPHALEIFLAQRSSVMFAFSDFDTMKRAVKYLPPVGVGIKYGIPQSRRASLMAPRQLFAASNMTQKWQRREIGNFQYLMFLNTIAGRTYQDLNQYPVFPWILTNYESEELDLNLPTNFRDLSKPVGALNNKRRAEFVERYQSWDNPKVPAFHYGTHYSTAAFTLNWLCRLRGSANSAYLALQDGKYEEETRLFLSIGDSWVSSLTGGQQNVKELIPEFFYLPEMFHTNLGLPEVEYPPWAKSAEEFVRLHRLALESELVSCQLHQWIDLIFGYKQRGPEAINAVNTFYYLTYQGNVNLNMIQDPALREAIETQIKHFGQTPSQLSTEPHPPRFSALHVAPLMFSASADEVNKVIKFPFNTSLVHISSCFSNYITNTQSSAPVGQAGAVDSATTGTVASSQSAANGPVSILTITSNNQYQIHKWTPNDPTGHPLAIDPQLEQTSASARRQLIDVDDMCREISLKLSQHETGECPTSMPDEIKWSCANYVVTLDGRYIIMGSFFDNSFRVFSTESGKLCQVIYGHRAPITCIVRSDGNAVADFYLATGSQDCSLLLWSWNEKFAQVEGSGVSAVHNPLPKLTICGHQTPVLSAFICAELGIIISGSKNLILAHTTTSGESLLEINISLPALLETGACSQPSSIGPLQRPQVDDKQKTLAEASMIGGEYTNQAKESRLSASASRSNSPSAASIASERLAQIRELSGCSDYYVTNLQLARELAFIVCLALPPALKKHRWSSSSVDPATESNTPTSSALLMTFNLKGTLMDCTSIGRTVVGPRLGDVSIMQLTRDGEHLILNDSPTSLKIYRTYDLQPIYAYNTNDIPHALADDQNRIRCLALVDHKHVLVGLENGKIIVYNVDFKSKV